MSSIERGLAVAAEGDAVHRRALGGKLLEHALQVGAHLLGGGQKGVVAPVAVPAAFAVDAVKIAYLALLGQQVDAQRAAQTAAEDGPENSFFAYHDSILFFSICKNTPFSFIINKKLYICIEKKLEYDKQKHH